MSSTLLTPSHATGYGSTNDSPYAKTDGSQHSCGSRVSALLDTLFFTRGTRIYEISKHRARDVDDALDLPLGNTTAACVVAFTAHYDAHGTGSAAKALLRTHARVLVMCALGSLALAAIEIFAPIVLHQVVLAFSTPPDVDVDLSTLATWLAVFIASRLVKVVVSTQVSYHLNVSGMRIAACMRSVLFRKAMRKSSSVHAVAVSSASTTDNKGSNANAKTNDSSALDIMNLATADVRTLQQAVLNCFNAITLPVQVVVMTYLLYAVLGVAAFAGVSVIVATLLLNYALSTHMSRSFTALRRLQDARMKTVSETFSAIQVVKLNAWESRFASKLLAVRTLELQALAAFSYAGAASVFLSWSSSLLVSTVAFSVYALVLGKTLTAAKVFTSMALFNALRDPLQLLPDTIQLLVQAAVSTKRLDAFLQMPEFTPDNVERAAVDGNREKDDNDVAVEVTDGCFAWSSSSHAAVASPLRSQSLVTGPTDDALPLLATTASSTAPPPPPRLPATLQRMTFRLQRGDFCVVSGSVGAGKSSLCAALLGEMHKRSGRVGVYGRVAYYAQQPWIQNCTVRENILFGVDDANAFDAARYDAVLDACCLREDLAAMPAGDATEIGEKGVNLSGGQKARVSLARAVYAHADVYILDSPLAAVDTVVQKAIFARCFCGPLLADKTVVLVTHNPEILASPAVTYRLRLASGGVLVENTRIATATPRRLLAQMTMHKRAHAPVEEQADASATKTLTKAQAHDGVLVQAEARAEGRVATNVWRRYLFAIGGARMLVLLLLSQLLWQCFQILSDVWLSHWTSPTNAVITSSSSSAAASTAASTTATTSSIDVDTFIGTYAKLAAAAAVMVFLRGVLVTAMGLRASAFLFDSMTRGLLAAPMSFFDTTPSGRVLNRYSGDLNAVDVVTPLNLSTCLSTMFTVVCSVVTASVALRSMSLCLVPIALLYAHVLDGYVRTFRDIRRLMGVAVSPILSHLAQSEQGVATIRAFGAAYVRRAIRECERRVDVNNALWYTEVVLIQWFSQRMQALCVGFLAIVSTSLVVFHASLSPGLVGLVFAYALVVDASLVTLIKTWSRAENSMVSVERVLEYSALEREEDDVSTASMLQIEPPLNWPARGALAFEHVSMRYQPRGPLVLSDVSFQIDASEKIGVVGRTGAGKTSLALALFRMHTLAGGRIVIDGVDIATLPLAVLRARLAIVPQSPVLLAGALRSFVDPFDDFPDADVLQALAHVELLETLRGYARSSSPAVSASIDDARRDDNAVASDANSNVVAMDDAQLHALDARVLALPLRAHGENLSVGERQLLCLARALLKRSSLVVMDEATAAVDPATERQLSTMLARELHGVTLITIAHRLATVLAADRVLVMQRGRVVEFASPAELLENKQTGVFYELVQEAKHSNSGQLKE